MPAQVLAFSLPLLSHLEDAEPASVFSCGSSGHLSLAPASQEQASQKSPCVTPWAGSLVGLVRMPLCGGPRARPATLNPDALPGLRS